MENLLVTRQGSLGELEIGRTYLDANLGLAKALMGAGKVAGAGKLAERMGKLQGDFGFDDIEIRCALECNMPSKVRRIKADSVWGKWAMALVEFVSWHELEEEGSTEEGARARLREALEGNVLVGFYLSFAEIVDDCLELQEELEGKGREMEGEDKMVAEAVEYSCSEQVGGWFGTDMAVEWVREEVLTGEREGGGGWMDRVKEIVGVEGEEVEVQGDGEGEGEEGEIDMDMYRGMLNTALEMVAESGVFGGEEGGDEMGEGGDGTSDGGTSSS